MLESLVGDNETLKRDNAELQHLLAESREDLHSLQEELEEQRVNTPSRAGGKRILYEVLHRFIILLVAGTPLFWRQHAPTGSVASVMSLKEPVSVCILL